jgi:hypothetical protein
MTMTGTTVTEEGIDWSRFEALSTAPDGRVRCRECGMTGYRPMLYFGLRYAWWGDAHTVHAWTCSSCPRAFTTAGGLSRHRRAFHP